MHTSEEIGRDGESSGLSTIHISTTTTLFHEMEQDVSSKSDGEEILLTL